MFVHMHFKSGGTEYEEVMDIDKYRFNADNGSM